MGKGEKERQQMLEMTEQIKALYLVRIFLKDRL